MALPEGDLGGPPLSNTLYTLLAITRPDLLTHLAPGRHVGSLLAPRFHCYPCFASLCLAGLHHALLSSARPCLGICFSHPCLAGLNRALPGLATPYCAALCRTWPGPHIMFLTPQNSRSRNGPCQYYVRFQSRTFYPRLLAQPAWSSWLRQSYPKRW